MQMLPNGLVNALMAPGSIDQAIKSYILAAKYTIQNDKTIAGTNYYHDVDSSGQTEIKFFTGNYVSSETNVPGNSFVRPQSEHQIIYGIRFFNGDNSQPGITDWIPGASAWLKNCVMTITSNNVVMIKDFPITEALGDLTVRDDGVIPFQVPFIWGGQETLIITVTNKNGVAAPINAGVRASLQAVGLI